MADNVLLNYQYKFCCGTKGVVIWSKSHDFMTSKGFQVTVGSSGKGNPVFKVIDTVSNLVFWSRFSNKLEPWHNVYIIQQ